MFEGLYGMYGNRISDVGGRRVLGMGGSLNAYIRTGNAYSGINSNTKTDNFVNKYKTRAKIDKFIAISSILGLGATLFCAFKCGKLNKDSFNAAFKKIKNFFAAENVQSVKNKFKNSFEDFKTKTSDATKNFGNKVKDAAENLGDNLNKEPVSKDIVSVVPIDVIDPDGNVVSKINGKFSS